MENNDDLTINNMDKHLVKMFNHDLMGECSTIIKQKVDVESNIVWDEVNYGVGDLIYDNVFKKLIDRKGIWNR